MIELLLGDCLDVLPTLDAASVHCCVTSPPYWGLRDYGVDGQLGLEKTPEEYVDRMVAVFREVRRVLRDDGTLWLNLGDSYNAYNGNAGPGSGFSRGAACDTERPKLASGHGLRTRSLKPKDLVGIPWMVAFALRADGWYLRSDIIWHKPNPMPESCTDRPTKAHEYLFLLTKSQRYYYDADAIQEPATFPGGPNAPDKIKSPHGQGFTRRAKSGNKERKYDHLNGEYGVAHSIPWEGSTRNKRSVWTIPTQAYAKAHFATFPERLVEPCILAGTSEEGCCSGCGAPYVRVVDKSFLPQTDVSIELGRRGHDGQKPMDESNSWQGVPRGTTQSTTTGWKPSCECAQLGLCPVSCTVLDPFSGSGTTGQVAQQFGRKFLGIELSAEYLELAESRFKQARLFA